MVVQVHFLKPDLHRDGRRGGTMSLQHCSGVDRKATKMFVSGKKQAFPVEIVR